MSDRRMQIKLMSRVNEERKFVILPVLNTVLNAFYSKNKKLSTEICVQFTNSVDNPVEKHLNIPK